MTVPSILSGIRTEMKHLADRQRVIAQNIANSETPGFKARDVAAPDFSAMLSAQSGGGGGIPGVARPTVQLTDSMAALGARAPIGAMSIPDPDVGETKPDGNTVTLEDQLLKMGQIQADFAAVTNIYRKQLMMLKSALGHGG